MAQQGVTPDSALRTPQVNARALYGRMPELVAEETFDIDERGFAVVSRGDSDGLPLSSKFPVMVEQSDGTARNTDAAVEHIF